MRLATPLSCSIMFSIETLYRTAILDQNLKADSSRFGLQPGYSLSKESQGKRLVAIEDGCLGCNPSYGTSQGLQSLYSMFT